MRYIGLSKRQASGGTCYQVRCYVRAASGRTRHSVGQYYTEEEAARAYDLAALALEKQAAELNLPRETYSQSDIQAMKEWLSRPRDAKSSQFVGVRQKKGRWDARARVNNKRVHLGYFDTQQDAAVQYDLAHLVTHQLNAAACSNKLNFDWSDVPIEQINNMTTNVRLRISQKVGPDIIEQQLEQQPQHPSSDAQQQHVSQLPTQQSQEQKQLHSQEQKQLQQHCVQETSQQVALVCAKQRAKQQVLEARLKVKQCKLRLQSKEVSKQKRVKLKAAKKAAKAVLMGAKQHLMQIKQQLAAAVGDS